MALTRRRWVSWIVLHRQWMRKMHLLRKFNEILEGFPSFMHLSILFFYDGACAAIFMIYKTFTCSPRIMVLFFALLRTKKGVKRKLKGV